MSNVGLTASRIKQMNRQAVLRFIIEHKTTSRQEIAAGLKLSMPTVLDNVNELVQMGFVTQNGRFQSTGGRKADMLCIVPHARLALGVDITKNHVGLVLVDLCGTILAHRRIGMPYQQEDGYYRHLGDLVRDFLQVFPVTQEQLLGTGISFPGILNHAGTQIVDSHVLGIRNIACEPLFQQLPRPCEIMNDANAAGFGELIRSPERSSFVYLSLSNSVGGAIFIDRKLYHGMNQQSGEFGHMRVVAGGRSCYCGQQGCLDAYCNALQLEELGNGSLEVFFQRLHANDTACVALWGDYLEWLSLFLINLRMAFDCDIILGGYVGAYLEPWLPQLREQLAQRSPFQAQGDFLHVCHYRREASAFGVAMQVIQKMLLQV